MSTIRQNPRLAEVIAAAAIDASSAYCGVDREDRPGYVCGYEAYYIGMNILIYQSKSPRVSSGPCLSPTTFTVYTTFGVILTLIVKLD